MLTRITTLRPLEVRRDGDETRIEGYAAVFFRAGDPGTEYELWPGTFERVLPGAFDSVPGSDVRAFWQHDSSRILGRTSSGTLDLSIDDVGLRYSIVAGSSPQHLDAIESIEPGDVDGSSFGFRIKVETWREGEAGGEIRELVELDVLEVSPVTFPAYTGTSAGLRSDGQGVAEIRAAREAARRDSERARRARTMDIDKLLLGP